MRIRKANTPTRLVGAEFEIDVWIWVDHKAGLFCPTLNHSLKVRLLPLQPEHSKSKLTSH